MDISKTFDFRSAEQKWYQHWLNQKYFSYATALRMVPDRKWEKLFGFPRRKAESPLEQHHCDLGLAIQLVTEELVIKMAQEAKKLTGCENLCW